MATFDGKDFGLGESYKIDVKFDAQVDQLNSLIARIKSADLGIDTARAALASFLKTLQFADSSGKSLDTIQGKFKGIREAIQKLGITGLDDAIKKANYAQINTAIGKNLLKFEEKDLEDGSQSDNSDKQDRGLTSASRMQRIARLITYVSSLGRAMLSFADRTAKANRELFLLASHAQSAVKDIASMGGALEAFGGTKGEATRFSRSFESEMAKMRVGQGTGGRFVEASRLWGLNFVPNDFKAQEREIVKFLSDKNRSQTEKIGLIDTLGLSQAQVSRYSQGIDAFDRENALQKSLHVNAEAAAEASQRYMLASQHLSAQMEDVKNAAMIPILNFLSPITEYLAESPKAAGILKLGQIVYNAGEKVLKLVAVMRLAGLGGGLFGGLFGKGAKTASTAASAASQTASTAATAASKTAGKFALGPIGAIVGLVSDVVGAGAGVVSSIYNVKTFYALKDIKDLVQDWNSQWKGFNGLDENGEGGEDALSARKDGIQIIATNTGTLIEIAREIARNGRSGAQGANAFSSQVTIEQISINVQSDSANPTDVAQAVHEHLLREMRDVVISLDPGGRV